MLAAESPRVHRDVRFLQHCHPLASLKNDLLPQAIDTLRFLVHENHIQSQVPVQLVHVLARPTASESTVFSGRAQ